MILALVLALAIGLSLGLLGGGGSILTVPILVYAARLEPRDAIATSLLVVGVTSLAAMLGHARGGRVSYRIGALFGLASMAGAYGGGRVAHLVPSNVLLGAFTALMAITGLAMLRKRRASATNGASEVAKPRLARAAGVGLAIGAVTGVVGAGGGFVVVPALVIFSGLPMPTAIGTSLLVIAMNSFAGLAGAAGHATIPWPLALAVSAVAVVGSVAGARFAGRVRPDRLRMSFAWLVIAMASFMILKQLHVGTLMTQFTPWSSLLGGALIGLSASLLLLFNGRVAGISGIVGGLVTKAGAGDRSWRAYFAIGMLAGGAALLVCQPRAFGATPVTLPLAIAAGLLVGFGTQLGSGCTSGHGVCGLSRRSSRSLAATLTFMLAAALAVFVVHHPGGGAP